MVSVRPHTTRELRDQSGDEAMDRSARPPSDIRARRAVPHPAVGSEALPRRKGASRRTPVKICVTRAVPLTCKRAVESKNVLVEAKYELGDLVASRRRPDRRRHTAMPRSHRGYVRVHAPARRATPGNASLAAAPYARGVAAAARVARLRALPKTKQLIRPLRNEDGRKRRTVESRAAKGGRAVATDTLAPIVKTQAAERGRRHTRKRNRKRSETVEPVKSEPVAPPKEEEENGEK